jgi:uncharacterized Zn-binding protein involved in type VI secretion
MPAICRVGDFSNGYDCYESTECIQGSTDVLYNGLGVCRVGDAFRETCCNTFPFPCHNRELAEGSANVSANGLAVGRVGDPLTDTDTIKTGSPDCFAN